MKGLQGRRVLIVEDEYLIAFDLADGLRAMGIEIVGPAQDAQSALRIIESNEHLDGAVLDILLAGDHVYAVADALRERQVPFVFMTGYGREFIPAAYADEPLCSKPCEPEMVAQTLFGRGRG